MNDERIERIENEADKRELTFFESQGNYCLCNVDWIGRFDSLEEVEEYLNI